ncbi:TetR/AcrR family transcriptional regulator [Marinilactibacillus sp. XAAS-LB27]|uniref:TetR/AcrR family transcriptional regulator n=1 Tax=Marinilactibacillus sp. XAAS-LB27 TaxID=3114538 RepID=UPI002E18BE87|nr:TetR/AcrR family transcriptional regulator [Marinilactibacillus sp. XAAS-LB27]
MSKKRQDVLEAAECLFYEEGFHAVGIKRIVSKSNVSLMTLYNHFESKEILILELLDHREQAYVSFLKNHVSQNKITDNLALKIATAHMNWLEANSFNGCMFLRAKEEYQNECEPIVDRVHQHKKFVIDMLESYGLSTEESLRLSLQLEGATALAETTDIQTVRAVFLSSVNTLFKAS